MAVQFLVDFMLGKLARELRIRGFDTQYIRPKNLANKNPLTLLHLAKAEERIILTRNTKLKNYPEVLLITSEKITEQINQVIEHFKLDKEVNLFTRCIICNEILLRVPKQEVRGKVPFYIFQTKEDFAYCPKCQKIYWAGTHLKNMKQRVIKSSNRE